MKHLILILLLLFISCESRIEESKAIIIKIEPVHQQLKEVYKYRYTIQAYPNDAVLYSNQYYKLRDTIKFK